MSVRYQKVCSVYCCHFVDRKRSLILCQDAEPPCDNPIPCDCSIFEGSWGFISFGYTNLKELRHILRKSVFLTKFLP